MITENSTLRDAKHFLNKNLDKGCVCPACEQTCKRYTRKLSSSMAYGLFLIQRISRQREAEWIHVENEFKNISVPSSIRGDVPKLRYWGLIERKDHDEMNESPSNGYYRITKHGEDFIAGRCTVRAKVKLYNNHFYGFDGAFLTFREALTNKFSYEEMMKGGPHD